VNEISLYERFLSASEAIQSKIHHRGNRAFFLGNEQLSVLKFPTEKFIQYSSLPGLEDQKIVTGGIYLGELAPDTPIVTEPMFENGAQGDVRLKALGIRILKLLGIEELFIFVTGGHLESAAGEEQLFWAEDHINLSGSNPLVGANIDEFGERFPDMTNVYDSELTSEGIRATENLGLKIKKGVWAATWEENFLPENLIGTLNKNKVNIISNEGMQEVIAAVHCKMRTALNLIINPGEKDYEILYKMLNNLSYGSK